MPILSYLFWPNPGLVAYANPKVTLLGALCLILIVLSLTLRQWRRRLRNPVTKRLSRSWSLASFWFGLFGLVLLVSRAEGISYLSMRFLWIVWLAIFLAYLFLQVKLFRARHYEVLPREQREDPREKYLPQKKKR